MIKLLINGLAASAGGGLTYLRNVVPHLSRRTDARTTVLLSAAMRRELGELANICFLEVSENPTAIRRFIREQTALPSMIRSSGAQVLISAGNFALWYCPIPQILLSRNSLYTSRDFLRDVRSRGEYGIYANTLVKGWLARHSVGRADITVSPSEAFAQELRQWSGKNIIALHHGFDPDTFAGDNTPLPRSVQSQLEQAKDCLRLVFVSHYNYYRNFETLFRAMPILTSRLQNKVKLFLTCQLRSGENPVNYLTGSASSLIDELHLKENVVELGTIPYRSLHHLYRACQIYVTPAYAESFAHPLIEAMSSGLPVVASDLPVHREICGAGAIYFNRFSPDELAERVLQVHQSPELAQELSSRGLRRARDFSWSEHVERLVELAKGLVGQEREAAMPQVKDATADIHVLTITPFFPSRENDVNGCFIAAPIAELQKFGIRSTVIAVSPIHYQRRHSHPSAEAVWIRYPQVPGAIGLSNAGNLLYGRLRRMTRSIHQQAPIDVIHAHAALPCGHAAMLLSRDLKIPFVVTVHGLDVFNTCSGRGIAAARRRKVSMDIYRATRNVICISSKVEEVLKGGKLAEIASTVVHNGVDPTVFSPSVSATAQPDLEILAVGALLPSKGQELVLRALEKLKSRFPRLLCRIVGEGPDGARLAAMVRQLSISSQVEFVSRLSRVDVADAMQRCSIFALPSWNEGLGCVYLEAMACAKPVIGCVGQGIEDVIEHGRNGWLVPPQALDQLVEGLSTLIASNDLRARIGDSARQTVVEKFTLAHQAQRLAGVYRQAIGVLPAPLVKPAAL